MPRRRNDCNERHFLPKNDACARVLELHEPGVHVRHCGRFGRGCLKQTCVFFHGKEGRLARLSMAQTPACARPCPHPDNDGLRFP
jgi:hypothetical protein